MIGESEIKKTHTFIFDVVSKIDKKRYYGKFTTHKLNMKDLIDIGAKKAQLMNGFAYNPFSGRGVGQETSTIVDMIAICDVALILRPAWAEELTSLEDMDILKGIFKEVNEFETSFLAPPSQPNGREGEAGNREDEPTGQSESSGQVESAKQQHDNITPLVGEKVPVATKLR